MQVVESLIEFKRIGDSSKLKDKRGKRAKGGGEMEKPFKESPPKPTFEKGKFRGNNNGGSDRPKKLACYFCGDPRKPLTVPRGLISLLLSKEKTRSNQMRVGSIHFVPSMLSK